MSVLRFKDGAGWHEIPAIVAQVTKERILAALGYTPAKESDLDAKQDALTAGENIRIEDNVISATGGGGAVDDVQVAGTSVVVDGVANVPVATVNNIGVVKANLDLGIGMAGQSMYIVRASDAEIDQRKANYRIISPTSLDYAVKAALCDGKGAAYTDAEKLAARERIGVDEWKVLESVTLSEEVASYHTGYYEGYSKILLSVSRPSMSTSTSLLVTPLVKVAISATGDTAWRNVKGSFIDMYPGVNACNMDMVIGWLGNTGYYDIGFLYKTTAKQDNVKRRELANDTQPSSSYGTVPGTGSFSIDSKLPAGTTITVLGTAM